MTKRVHHQQTNASISDFDSDRLGRVHPRLDRNDGTLYVVAMQEVGRR